MLASIISDFKNPLILDLSNDNTFDTNIQYISCGTKNKKETNGYTTTIGAIKTMRSIANLERDLSLDVIIIKSYQDYDRAFDMLSLIRHYFPHVTIIGCGTLNPILDHAHNAIVEYDGKTYAYHYNFERIKYSSFQMFQIRRSYIRSITVKNDICIIAVIRKQLCNLSYFSCMVNYYRDTHVPVHIIIGHSNRNKLSKGTLFNISFDILKSKYKRFVLLSDKYANIKYMYSSNVPFLNEEYLIVRDTDLDKQLFDTSDTLASYSKRLNYLHIHGNALLYKTGDHKLYGSIVPDYDYLDVSKHDNISLHFCKL